MTTLDRPLLAEKVAAVERHLARVAARLPLDAAHLLPSTDASDAVILHLWQAVQIALDVAMTACVGLHLPAPGSSGEAFRLLAAHGHLDRALAERQVRAAGFRDVVAHAYEGLDMARVHRAATDGPADLRAFLATMRDALPAR